MTALDVTYIHNLLDRETKKLSIIFAGKPCRVFCDNVFTVFVGDMSSCC